MSSAPELRLVIGFSPGSASDDIANLIAAPLGDALGRRVIIQRIAGDNGALAAHAVAQSVPDGNTLLVATLGTHALAPHVRRDLPYDPLRDFEPVALLTTSPMVLACHPSQPFTDVPSLIAYARAHPGELAYGTSAIGGAPHLASELFQMLASVELRHARYEDTRKLYADLERGEIALSFNNIMSMMPRCQSGKLRALGITSVGRVPLAPDVPTFQEFGLRDCHMSNWTGLVAPRGTPTAIADQLDNVITSGVLTPEIVAILNANGLVPCNGSPIALRDFIADEIRRWGPVVARFRHT